MAINQLNGLGSIRFYYGTLADWNASGIILSVNEIAIVTDVPGSYKQGQALPSMGSSGNPKTGPTFAQLPWFTPSGSPQPGPIIYSLNDGVLPHSGGGQTNAVLLTSEYNILSNTAANGDSVKLPATNDTIMGMRIVIVNLSSFSVAVFPSLGDSIYPLATNAADNIPPGAVRTYISDDNLWLKSFSQGPAAVVNTPAAINASATALSSQVAQGAITSTSAAPVALVLPTATLLAAYLQVNAGDWFDFAIDNSAGANPVTLTLGAGMTQPQNDTGALVVGTGQVGLFRAYFESTTTLVLSRINAGNSVRWYSPTAAQQALSGAGAVNITSYYTALTVTGTQANTLANATVTGQVKKITAVTNAGPNNATLTLTGYTSIVFTAAAQYVILQWNGAAWVAIEASGVTINP